jgi:RNA polymerase sigma-70 factor (ECF subfamily)
VVEAFLAASRDGDFEALLAVLDPDVTLQADEAVTPPGVPRQARGAAIVARQGLAFSRRAQSARLALVNGTVGVILAPRGRLSIALSLTIVDDKITAMDVVADPERLAGLDLAVVAD